MSFLHRTPLEDYGYARLWPLLYRELASPERGHTNREYLDGALGMARSMAPAVGLHWDGIIDGARQALGCELGALLDQTRQLDT